MSINNATNYSHASFHGRIGIARADITPPVGIYARNWGAAIGDVATAIHRPLTLTALTLNSVSPTRPTEQPLVLVDADLGWWKTPRVFHRFSARLLDALSLPPENMIFALSHTHSAPPLIEPDSNLPGHDLLKDWLEHVFTTTVQTVRNALGSQVESVLDWQLGRCGLASVRDLPDPDAAKSRVICGFNPNRQADDSLLLGRVTDGDGRLRATLTNYACHPTTLAWDNTAISPDYVGAMRETVQQFSGAPALFMLGACGDLAPRHQYVGDPAIADKHGKQLGFASLATLQNMEPPATRLAYAHAVESGAPLAVWKHQAHSPSRTLRALNVSAELPIKDWPSADELEQQRSRCTDRVKEERLRRKRDIRQALGDAPSFNLPVYTWRIGDAVLVGSCCEAYSLLQRELRDRFPDRTVLCMNLINGSLGYLPPAALYDSDAYQVWQTPFGRGSFERTLDAMTEAITNVLSS